MYIYNIQALRETCYVGIPTIAFAGVDCNLKFVDCAIPINNRGKYSIGLIFYLLAREYKRMKGDIPRNEEWGESVDLFFYRTQDEVIKMQEKEKQKNLNENVDDTDDMGDQDVVDDAYPDDNQQQNQQNQQQMGGQNIGAPTDNVDNDDAGWEEQPPQYDDDDDGWGGNADANMDFDTW